MSKGEEKYKEYDVAEFIKKLERTVAELIILMERKTCNIGGRRNTNVEMASYGESLCNLCFGLVFIVIASQFEIRVRLASVHWFSHTRHDGWVENRSFLNSGCKICRAFVVRIYDS